MGSTCPTNGSKSGNSDFKLQQTRTLQKDPIYYYISRQKKFFAEDSIEKLLLKKGQCRSRMS